MSQNTKNGFTLVELAISLMVIGLLLGGVLKGRELIDNSRVTSVFGQIKSYDAATMSFLDGYGGLPGDISDMSGFPNCVGASCIGGNGDGLVGGVLGSSDPSLTAKQEEVCNFFVHLSRTGFIQEQQFSGASVCQTAWSSPGVNYMAELMGNYMDRNRFPVTQIKDVYVLVRAMGNSFPAITSTLVPTYTPETHYYNLYPLSIKQAHAIDKKFDDGNALDGSLVVVPNTVCHNTDGVYNLQSNNINGGNCHFLIKASF